MESPTAILPVDETDAEVTAVVEAAISDAVAHVGRLTGIPLDRPAELAGVASPDPEPGRRGRHAPRLPGRRPAVSPMIRTRPGAPERVRPR